MPRDFTAFTVRGNGLLRVLISDLSIRPAVSMPQTPASPPVFRGRAIWDTGATRTCITPDVVKALALEPISVTEVHGVSGRFETGVYKVDIILPNGVVVLGADVVEARQIHGADALVGMDIIAAGDFAVTNAEKQTVFSFRFPPDEAHTDYVEQAREIASKRQRRTQAQKLQRRGKLGG